MKAHRSALAATLIGCTALSSYAQSSTPSLQFSGFGTASVVHSDDRSADYTSSTYQPTGAGYTNAWSTTPDSALGVQADMMLTKNLSAVVQVISKYRYDNTYTPQFEWANAKYRFTDDFSVRLGRIALPTFLYSETRLVSYPNLWVRPPYDVYGSVTNTHNDGIDASYHSTIGGVNNTVQAYYGDSLGKAPWGRFKSKQSFGIYNTVETSSLALRAGFVHAKVDINVPGAQPIFDGFAGYSVAPTPDAAQAAVLADRYSGKDMPITVFSLGATYDPGKWLVTGEYVDFRGAGLLVDNHAFYVTGGYRIGKFTPYATYAKVHSEYPAEPTSSVDPTFVGLVAGLNGVLRLFSPSQHTTSLGVRWDAAKNMAIKLQLDQVVSDDGSPGRFVNQQASFQSGNKVNMINLSLDFVF